MLKLGSLSDVGMVRETNQDAFCALLSPNAPLAADALLAVADGMGGHAAGDVASRLAIQTLVASLGKAAQPDQPGDYRDRLKQAVIDSNSKVFEAASQPEYRGMGTTMTAAVIIGSSAAIAQVGDSRAYLLRNGGFQQITRDHSWVQEQVSAGAITQEQAKTHPRRNVLTRAVGTAANVEVDAGVIELEDGDRLLLCSDGLHGLVSDEEMGKMILEQEPQEACTNLVALANERGGNDNSTVVVAVIESTDPDSDANKKDPDRLHRTTLEMPGSKHKRSGRRKLLLVLTSIVWVPLWLIGKLIAAPFKKRN